MRRSGGAVEPLTSSDFEIRQPKILLFDIETAPNIGYTWGKFEQNVIKFIQESYVLCWSAKWLNGEQITLGLDDFPKVFKADKTNDGPLLKKLYDLMESADVICAHNGDRFDIPRVNARFLMHGFKPTRKYLTRDTKKMLKAKFSFNTNNLDDVAERFGFGNKIKTDFSLWLGCMNGDAKSWKLMKQYNARDTRLLEKVYLHIRPWDHTHPNTNVFMDRPTGCPKCGGTNIEKRGFNYTRTGRRQEFRCKSCGGCSYGKHQAIAEVR